MSRFSMTMGWLRLLSLLAKEVGVGTAIYNDIFDVSA